MTTRQNLDQRYLEFAANTRRVFERFPQLEPLRQFIFRELLVQPRPFGWRESAKQWLRPLVRRGHSAGVFRPCDILIWIEGTREVIRESLLPVFHELTSRGANVQLVSMNGPADLPPSCVTLRFPSVFFLPAWTKQAWEALCQAEKNLAQPALARWFFNACADVQGLLNEVDQILDATRPRVVVTASTQLIGGAALLVSAQAKQMRTILLQHGVLQPFYIPMLADRMCTWGRSSSETLTSLGTDRQRLEALGSPRHDAMRPAPNGQAKQQLLRSLSLEDKLTIAFFSNGNDLSRNGSAPGECVQWLEAAAERYRGRINIIVRLHPNEDGSLYRPNSHLVITKDCPEFALLLDGCDCVASLCSTAMLDALLYQKPVWHFHADGWPELATNWQEGLAQRIGSANHLCAMIEQALQGKALQDHSPHLAETVFVNHGRATQAVADFLVTQADTCAVM